MTEHTTGDNGDDKKLAINEYLSRFSSTPYSYPLNDYQLSSGTTAPKGSWFQAKK
jgi:hypothetical protein